MLQLKDFSGGLNLRDSNNSLEVNESPDMMNFSIRARGSLKKRPGTVQVSIPPGAKSIYRYFPSGGAGKLIVSNPWNVYVDFTTYSSLQSNSNRNFAVYGKGTNYTLLVMSQEHVPQLWDGTGYFRDMNRIVFSGGKQWTIGEPGALFTAPMYKVTIGCIHYDRLFTAGSPDFPSTIHFSEPGHVEWYDENNYIDIEPYDNEPILALVPAWDNLVIFKRNGIWILYGSDITNFSLKRVSNTKKILPNFVRTIVNIDNVIIFRATDGVYAFDGTNFSLLSEKIDPALKLNQTSTSCAAWYDGEYWLSNGSETFVFNLASKCWTRHSIKAVQFLEDNGALHFLDDIGRFRALDPNVATDLGFNYTAYYKTPYLDFGDPTMEKDFLNLKADALSVGSGVSVEFDIDDGKTHGVFSLPDGSANLPKWGQVTWGNFKWSTPGAMSAPLRFPHASHGERLQLQIYVKGDELTEFTGLIVKDAPKREVW